MGRVASVARAISPRPNKRIYQPVQFGIPSSHAPRRQSASSTSSSPSSPPYLPSSISEFSISNPSLPSLSLWLTPFSPSYSLSLPKLCYQYLLSIQLWKPSSGLAGTDTLIESYAVRTWVTRSWVACNTLSANSGAVARQLVSRSVTRSAPNRIETPVTPTPAIKDLTEEHRRLFTKVENKWSQSDDVEDDDMKSLARTRVSAKKGFKLTASTD